MYTLCRLAAGVLQGRDHASAQKNRQDACASAEVGDAVFGFVSDGCGQGAASEVGAHLTVALARSAAMRALSEELPLDDLPNTIAAAVLGGLDDVARHVRQGERDAFVRSHLLATLVGFVVRGEEGVVFAAGDGLIAIDDEVVTLEEDNRPHYLAYGLSSGTARLGFVRRVHRPAWVAVASDGLTHAGLAALAKSAGRNLTRHLVLLQRAGALADDGAVVLAQFALGGSSCAS